jgi:RNA polymerase primary sigma factor
MDTFRQRLAAALEVAEISKQALAERIGQPPSAVSNWLSGARAPSPEAVERLATGLDVGRKWLANGTGPMPVALRDRELAELSKVRWAARPVPEDGARTGGNPALFAIRPTLQVLIREALQNSTDVRLDGGPATVDVRLLGLTGDARAAFLEALRWKVLRGHLKASVEAAEDQQIATALREGLEIDRGGELLVLLIADYNTQGLTGPETGKGNFAGLTRDTLFSNKGGSHTAGGSHGVGKFTAVRGSAINTVLYLSDLSDPEPASGKRTGRLLGRSELAWHPNPAEGRDCDGPMWLGETDGPDAIKALSHWADDGDLLVQALRMTRNRGGSPGTTLAIVGLRDLSADRERTPAEMVADLRDEVARSFFAALEDGSLQVNVDYVQLDDAPAGADPPPGPADAVRPDQTPITKPLVGALRAHADDTVVDELVDEGEVLRVAVPLQVPARRDGVHSEFTHEAVLLVRRAAVDELDDPSSEEHLGRVALLRGRKMVIKRLDAAHAVVGAHPFQAVLLAGEAAGDSQEDTWAEEFLRLAEPPAHDDWHLTETLRQLYKTGAGRKLTDFEKAIRRAVHDAVVREVELDSDGPRDLSRRFRFGTPPTPERAPRLVVDERTLLSDGAWEVSGTLRVRGDHGRALHGTPRLVFAGESGKRSTAKWRELTAISNCTVDSESLSITVPAGKRSARFRAVSDPDSHPVASSDAAVAVTFHVERTA